MVFSVNAGQSVEVPGVGTVRLIAADGGTAYLCVERAPGVDAVELVDESAGDWWEYELGGEGGYA